MYRAAYACGDDALTLQSAILITWRTPYQAVLGVPTLSAASTLTRRVRVAPLFLFRAKNLSTSTAAQGINIHFLFSKFEELTPPTFGEGRPYAPKWLTALVGRELLQLRPLYHMTSLWKTPPKSQNYKISRFRPFRSLLHIGTKGLNYMYTAGTLSVPSYPWKKAPHKTAPKSQNILRIRLLLSMPFSGLRWREPKAQRA